MLRFLERTVPRSKIIFNKSAALRCYHENVIDHYENPRNVGSLDKKKKNVGTGKRNT